MFVSEIRVIKQYNIDSMYTWFNKWGHRNNIMINEATKGSMPHGFTSKGIETI